MGPLRLYLDRHVEGQDTVINVAVQSTHPEDHVVHQYPARLYLDEDAEDQYVDIN